MPVAEQPRALAAPLLQVEKLVVSFGATNIINGVSFTLDPGQTLGIVGESGSGKSMTALALMRLLPAGATLRADRLELLGESIAQASNTRLEELRGATMGMIFQEPMTALNPVLTIGDQLMETVRRHAGIGRREARNRTIEALRRVGIPSPEQRVDEFPHKLSGGMRQRVMIAMALICQPKLLIADEPTTALDVTIQAQILDLMLDLQDEYNMGIILISHDLSVVSAFTDRVLILYLGRVMEDGQAARLFGSPHHPYTEALLDSVPPIHQDVLRLRAIDGTVPPPFAVPPGCPFQPRCTYARPPCASAVPPLADLGGGHRAACIRNTGYEFRDPVR